MFLVNPENRRLVTQYLESVSEDDFIDDIIIPTFSQYGYRVYRRPTHGPGEHGKDVVFVRYDPLRMAEEFIAVQAKAEKCDASNVAHFSDQTRRALETGFRKISEDSQQRPHLALFINARRHTNDADEEFIQLVGNSPHVTILSQDHVCDLMLRMDVAPDWLRQQLIQASPLGEHGVDQHVYRILMDDDPSKVDRLLDHELKLIGKDLSQRMKGMVIDYAITKWDNDPTWGGTVRPMRWLDEYFEFFQSDQYAYLMRVLHEYTASNPSYAASSFTHQVFSKITPQHLSSFADEFVQFAVRQAISHAQSNTGDVMKLAKQALDAKVITNPMLERAIEYWEHNTKAPGQRDKGKLESLYAELCTFAFDLPT